MVPTKRSNARGAKGPCYLRCLQHKKDEMTTTSIDLQGLRRRYT